MYKVGSLLNIVIWMQLKVHKIDDQYQRGFKIKDQNLEEVKVYKYLGINARTFCMISNLAIHNTRKSTCRACIKLDPFSSLLYGCS